jgi:hypothetical protein
MNRFMIGAAVVVALALVTVGVVAAAKGPGSTSVAKPALVSMDEAAQAMQQAGAAMQAHGQAMVDQGTKTGSQALIATGRQWLQDGQQIAQGGQWMAMDPTDPSNLDSPTGVATDNNRSELSRHAQAMLHDPSKAGAIDIEALRDNGLAMQSESQNMVAHAHVMAQAINVMVAQDMVDDQIAADLRRAVQILGEAGNQLGQNAQQMVEYANRLHQSLGGRH